MGLGGGMDWSNKGLGGSLLKACLVCLSLISPRTIHVTS